jgi:hypothetical protein
LWRANGGGKKEIEMRWRLIGVVNEFRGVLKQRKKWGKQKQK